MIPASDLKKLARDRLKDAQVLLANNRYDGAVYLCGYVVELALKARICRTLKWKEYPETKGDFSGFQAFKVHDLDQLLRLSGREAFVKAYHFAEWTAVSQWNPESRYQPSGTVGAQDARDMISAADVLLKRL